MLIRNAAIHAFPCRALHFQPFAEVFAKLPFQAINIVLADFPARLGQPRPRHHRLRQRRHNARVFARYLARRPPLLLRRLEDFQHARFDVLEHGAVVGDLLRLGDHRIDARIEHFCGVFHFRRRERIRA